MTLCQLQYNIIIEALGAMQRKQSRFSIDNVGYSQHVREFLSTFKVSLCLSNQPHVLEWCENYHSRQDRRRNPYNGYYMAYYPSAYYCNCEDENCKATHNIYEHCYHPFIYKTAQCFSQCNNNFLCYGFHKKDVAYLQKHQFFRFDLQTFKTTQCQMSHSNNNEYASCRFYHGDGDRRRDLTQFNYSHLECGEKSECKSKTCQFAHNKIEQLYHPQRYKSKYCSRTLKNQSCEYLQFCSFAHSDEEITIELLHKIPVKDQKFTYYKFKTVWCPFTENHERSTCDYAHNFNDYRRDPLRFKYDMGDCPYWNKNKTIDSLEHCGCQKRMDCTKCHGWFETKYHPDNLLKTNNEGDEEKMNSRNLSSQKNPENPRRQDGLGTGAPFYRIEEKRDVGPNPKRNEKKQDKNEIKQSNNDQNRSQIIEKKGRGSNKKSASNMKNMKKWLFINKDDANLWISSPRNYEGNARSSPKFFRGQNCNNTIQCENNKSNCFTPSFKKLIAHYGLEQKLLNLGLHQITLLSLSKEEINKQKHFKEWSMDQRQNLLLAVSKYNNENEHIKYSQSFVHIFRSHQGRGILEKLHTKKIPQKKLLALSQNSINKLSFLGDQEKQKLPVILQTYVDERNFKELNQMIKIETQSPT